MLPQTNQMPQKVPLRFTVDEYYKLIDLGMLHDYEQAEIIEGELIRKMPIGDKHAAVVERLNEFLRDELGKSVSIRSQQPIRLNEYTEPQPDLAVLKRRDDFYRFGKPLPQDVLCLIEVSDATLRYDRDSKLSMYAEAEILETWIVNLQKNIIEVHQHPNLGVYQLTKLYKCGETVTSETIPNLQIEVDKILGE